MHQGYRHKVRFLSQTLLSAAMLLGALASRTHAQWAWAKSVGISGTTVWHAAARSESGEWWFGGVSEKLVGTPVRGFIMAHYGDSLGAKWNTKLLGGNGAWFNETCIGIDSAGNSYMIDKWQDTPLILPDSSQISYFLACYFVSKYQPDGKLAWAKKLTAGGIHTFQVMSDGTVGIVAKGIIKTFLWGNDTIQGAASGADNYFIEVKGDGTIGRSVALSDINADGLVFTRWKEPGKAFAVMTESPSLGTDNFHRGMIDLDAKTFTEDGTPLTVQGSPYTFRWENNGFPNSPTTVLEPKSGHLFVLMSAIGGNPVLNDADTLKQQTNSQVKDGYVVELDDQMKVVRKIRLTNPLLLSVRDSLVVVTAVVRATNDFGFVSPDTTIKITLKSNNTDGYVVYAMDRDFKYRKHGLLEGLAQTALSPNLTFIDDNGGVYLSLYAGGDVTYQGLPVVNRGRVLGTMVSKLGIAPNASVAPRGPAERARAQLDADGRLILDRPGTYRYALTNLQGERIAAGEGSGRSVCDISRAPQGMYFLTLKEGGRTGSQVVWKFDR